jgi:hypothetical protein
MDQFSSARLSEPGLPVPPSDRLGSGARRVSATALVHPASVPSEALLGRRSGVVAASGVARRWRIEGPLRMRCIGLSVAVATLAGGAGPLLASNSGSEAPAPGVALVISQLFLSLAVLAWTSPYWQAEVRLDRFRSWFRAWLKLKLKLLALDVRALPRAPKNLALYLASHWLLRVGLAGLLASGALSLGPQFLGLPIATPLLGVSLSSAALVAVSALLGWALRLQPRGGDASPDALALAVREFPALVDASRRLEIDTVFMQPTLLHQVLDLLPSWRDVVRGAGADGYASALQRHLWRGIPRAQIARLRALGSAQADDIAELLIDDAVLVAVHVGIDGTRAHSLAERLRNLARRRGARASVVVLVEARSEVLRQADVVEPLRGLHEALPVVVAVLP